jgi:uncharacterized protein YdhG (YjbR/CyaY superfamily)
MISKAVTVDEYINELPEERREAMLKLRQLLKSKLPKGFQEQMAYGMITYVVPHSLYPQGYHCKPEQALPFISLGSQKNYIALHHMGLYANETLLNWFQTEYAKASKFKLDMGKGCVRFKKPEHIPYELIAELAEKVSVKDWISEYEKALKR